MDNPCFKRIQMWSDSETRFLLDRYASYIPEIGPMKSLRNKKEMWEIISTEIEGRTAKQCEERYKTVRKRRKVVAENNHTSAAKRQRIELAEELETISAMDDLIVPEVQMSTQAVAMKVTTTPNAKAKEVEENKSVRETLLEIAKRKEDGRERRHREKMESLGNIQRLLANLLQNGQN